MENEREPEPVTVLAAPDDAHTSEQPDPGFRNGNLPPLWRQRDFMLLWSGQVVSVTGTRSSQIVYPLLILSLTGSPAAAGAAAALYALPYLLLSLPAGVLVDRLNRKRVMIWCDAGRALALASIPLAMAYGRLTIWQIYAASLIDGALFVFFNIAEVAALVRVVAKEQLPPAAAQMDIADSVAGIVGPTLGTVLYQIGRAIPFLFDAITFALSGLSLAFIRTRFQSEDRGAGRIDLAGEIRDGLRWLWREPLIRYFSFLTGALNFVNSATTLVIIVLAQRLGASDSEIGVIFGLSSAGVIAGAVIGGQIQRRYSFRQVIPASMWISALLFPLLALAPHYWFLAVISGLSWMAGTVYNVVQFSYRITRIPDELQGRVNSVYRLIAFGLQPAGAFLVGILIERSDVYVAVAVFSLWYIAWAIATTLNGAVRAAFVRV